MNLHAFVIKRNQEKEILSHAVHRLEAWVKNNFVDQNWSKDYPSRDRFRPNPIKTVGWVVIWGPKSM
jgi:hypothetical protein